jgi:hypothetical protein
MARLIKTLLHNTRKLLGKTAAGRNTAVLPDDVFLTSYPRSGNTWTRFLIANLVYPQTPASFANIEELIPTIHRYPNRWLLQRSRPRLLKSHEYFDPRYPKVIYVVRDPRDVAVSMYHYCIKRGYIADDCPLGDFIPRFVAGKFFNEFGTWGEHVSSWVGVREDSNRFLLVKYEDLLQDTIEGLDRIAAFLQCPRDRNLLDQAVQRSSAEEMRKLEKKQSADWFLTRGTRSDKPFVRAANSGEGRRALAVESLSIIEAAWGPIMKKLGYESCAELEHVNSAP